MAPSYFFDDATGAPICLTGNQFPFDFTHVHAAQVTVNLHKRSNTHLSKLGINQVGDRLDIYFTCQLRLLGTGERMMGLLRNMLEGWHDRHWDRSLVLAYHWIVQDAVHLGLLLLEHFSQQFLLLQHLRYEVALLGLIWLLLVRMDRLV